MQLDGMILTKCPPEQVVQLLLTPDAVRKLLPEGCEVGERKGDTVPFVILRRVGPIKLSMAGTLTLTPAADGQAYELVIQASHIVAGRVRVAMELMPDTQTGRSKRLRWNGNLDAHGLAARLVEGRRKRVRGAIENLFIGLRDQIEWA